MADSITFVLAHVVATLAVLLTWLSHNHLKLRGELRVLQETVERNEKEINGLVSSSVVIDNRMAVTDQQLRAVSEKVSTIDQNDQSAHPYNGIIQKIRHGAGIDELMRDCNLCRDEAVLLMRLYGTGSES